MTRPEDRARELIEQRLVQAGWVIQDMPQFNPAADRGVAVREFPTDTGPADYVLLVNREPVGVIEAKRDEEGQRITEHEAQTERYANATLKWRVLFLRVTNLTHDGSLDFSVQVFVAEDIHRKFLARSIVKPGDVLMNIVGPPLGQVSMVSSTFPEWNVNQAIAIFRVQPELLNEFLAYVLLSPGAGRWLQARAKTTAGQTNLTLEVCRALPVPVLPLAEQAEIVSRLNRQLEALTDQGRAIDRALAMASAQRQNILRAAFSGQLVPQDPNDEPASVLLERIRAQRQAAAPAAKRKPGRPAKAAA